MSSNPLWDENDGREIVGRGEESGEAWNAIVPLHPSRGGRRGGQWRHHQTVFNGILWKLRTDALWRNLPEHYGL